MILLVLRQTSALGMAQWRNRAADSSHLSSKASKKGDQQIVTLVGWAMGRRRWHILCLALWQLEISSPLSEPAIQTPRYALPCNSQSGFIICLAGHSSQLPKDLVWRFEEDWPGEWYNMLLSQAVSIQIKQERTRERWLDKWKENPLPKRKYWNKINIGIHQIQQNVGISEVIRRKIVENMDVQNGGRLQRHIINSTASRWRRCLEW